MVKIVQRRKIWFALSSILVFFSITALFMWNLKFGIDFTGGTLMEFSFKDQILSSQEIKDSLSGLELGDINVQFSADKNVLLRFKDVGENIHQEIINALNETISKKEGVSYAGGSEKNNDTEEEIKPVEESASATDESLDGNEGESAPEEIAATDENSTEEDVKVETVNLDDAEKNMAIEEKRFDSIGPVIGNELKAKAIWAIAIALIAIILYIGWAFRKVSRPVSSFKYGIIATIALFHDIIITLGVFSILGYLYNVEVGISFIAALLAILGYSVNDTIVVFDRTRENLLRSGIDDFEEIVNKSVNETFIRSLNTSFTTLLVLAALYLFGGSTIKYFVVALLVGISAGTYSSIFIASPLLVSWQKWSLRKK